MATLFTVPDSEYRNLGGSLSRRAGLAGLLLAALLGAALSTIINEPFEGRLQAVVILGAAEALVVWLLVRAAALNWRHHRSPLPPALLAAVSRRRICRALRSTSSLLGVVQLDRDELRHLFENEAASRAFGERPGGTAGKLSSELAAGGQLAAALFAECNAVRESNAPRRFSARLGEAAAPGTWLSGEVLPLDSGSSRYPRFCYLAQDLSSAAGLRGPDSRVELEHKTVESLLKLASLGGPLPHLIDAVTAAGESLLDFCDCYAAELNSPTGAILLHCSQQHAARGRVLPKSIAGDSAASLQRLLSAADESVITDLSSIFSPAIGARLSSAGFSRCKVRRIQFSDGAVWGALLFLRRCGQGAESDAARLSTRKMLAQLASTFLERSILVSQLQERTARSNLAERAGKIGIWDWDVASGKVIWSDQMLAMMRVTPESFRHTYENWSKLVVPEDLARIESALRSLFEKRAHEHRDVYRMRLSDGEIHWFESVGAIYYDSAGNAARMVGTFADITDRRQMERRLEEERRRLELVLEAAQLGFWDWHIPTGHVTFGGGWASMLGYRPEEIQPHVSSWEALVHPDDRPEVRRTLDEHLAGESAEYSSEHRLRRRDGSWLWILDRGRVVERDETGKAVRALGIHADISEQRAARQALKDAARRKDEFLATLAHELRNPLAPIRTGLTILKQGPTPDDAARTLNMMERQVVSMVRLIDDLLDVARITQGRLELRRSPVSLQQLLESAIESARPAIEAAQHSLVVRLPGVPILINGDEIRLVQVVLNILSNAAKYTPNGGTITLEASRTNGTAEIAVRDTGLGIPKDKLEAVFDMFAQVDEAAPSSRGGLGIGLAIVRKLVEMHGGDVRAESNGVGTGSTFRIHLPVLASEKAAAPQPLPPPQKLLQLPQDVLVVDDNEDGAESLAIFLSMLGHKAVVAHSGVEALELLKGGLPKTIFLDIGLPGLSGYEVAERIRSLPGGTDVTLVALTGWGTREDKERAKAAGFSEHLTKPVDLHRVEQILEAHGQASAVPAVTGAASSPSPAQPLAG